MNDWTTYRIKDVCRIIGGNPAPKGDHAFGKEGAPFLKMKDLGKHHLTDNLIDIENKVSKEVATRDNLKIVKKGSILLPRSGSVALNHRAILGVDAYMVSHICALEVIDTQKVYNMFLYYLLRRLKLDKITKKTTGLDAITFQDLGNITISLPSFLDQHRIATTLGKVEALIAQRKESLRLLSDLLKSTFWEMFGNPFHEGKPIPLGNHLRLQNGFAFKSFDFTDEGIPVIKIGTVNKGFFDLGTLSFLPASFINEFHNYVVKPGDLLLSLTGTVGKDDYANTCFVTGTYKEYLLNQRVAKLLPDENYLRKNYLHFLFKHPSFKKQLIKANRGVRQANLSNDDIYSIKISMPPIELQAKFSKLVEKVEVLKIHYQASLKELENLYGSLSQLAFKGELDLSKIELETQQAPPSPIEDELPVHTNQLTPEAVRQLRAERKKTGRTPLNIDYVKQAMAAQKLKGSLSYLDLKKTLEQLPYDMKTQIQDIQQLILNLLESEPPFLEQVFDLSSPDSSEKQIMFRLIDEN